MSNKLKKNEYDDEMSFIDFIIGVFAVIGFIFFLGELFSDSETKEPVKILPKDILKSKIQRLEEIKNKLNELRPQKAALKRTERTIYKWSRAVIAMGFIVTNIIVLAINNWTFILGLHLNVNGAIITVYGFFAFIIYGSPGELVKAIKEKTANYLKKKHIHTLTELKELEQEHRTLLKEILDLETNITENTNTIKQISNA